MNCFARILVITVLTLGFLPSIAQNIQGVVRDAKSKAPVAGASVFLNNTSVGTVTSENGSFVLPAANGRFDLVVSAVGYSNYTYPLIANDSLGFLEILIQEKPIELKNIGFWPFTKDEMKLYEKNFLDDFIGNTNEAKKCKLLNPKALKFGYLKSSGTLTVSATEALIIENKALGYTIQYQLEGFEYNVKTRALTVMGYPYFIPMTGNAAKMKKWEKARIETYNGSLLHFLRSLYRNTLAAEGFQLRWVQKLPNVEKLRVKELVSSWIAMHKTIDLKAALADSSKYYNKVMQEEDTKDIIGKTLLTGDSIAYAQDPTTVLLHFPNYVMVDFPGKKTQRDYRALYPKSNQTPVSQMSLVNLREVVIQANGSFFDPSDLLLLGYWAWSEKLSTLLPIDYQLPGPQRP